MEENLDVLPNAILVTFDVVSLYTNIPNHEGMLAVEKYLTRNKPPVKLCYFYINKH